MLPKHSLKGLSDLEIRGIFLVEIHSLFLLLFLFSVQGSWDKSALHELPSPIRKEVLQWEMMLLTQQLLLLSEPASVNVAACYIGKRDRMHKSKHSDRRERERRNTEEANQIKTWNSHPDRKSSVCQSSSLASWLPESQQEIHNVQLTFKVKFLWNFCLFWYFKHIQVPDFTNKKEIFIYVVHGSSEQNLLEFS